MLLPDAEQFDHVQERRLRMLLDHWRQAWHGDRLPSRHAIDPIEIPKVLPIIWLCEHVPEGDTFRYRLAGEEVNGIFGRSLRGLVLEDFVSPARLDATRRAFLACIRDCVVGHRSGPLYQCRGRLRIGERIVLPLATDGRHPDAIVGATATAEMPEGTQELWQTNQVTRVSLLTGDRVTESVRAPIPVLEH